MCRVGVHSGVPHCRNHDRWRAHRKIEPDETHPCRVSAGRTGKTRTWHKRHQVRIARDAYHIWETRHDGDDLSPKSKLFQCIVDRPRKRASSRRNDMTVFHIALRSYRPHQQWMSGADSANEVVTKNKPRAHLRRGYAEHSDLKIDLSIPQRETIFVRLGRKSQVDRWCDLDNGRYQGSGKEVHEPFARANGKGSLERRDVEVGDTRRQHRAHISGQLMDPITQLGGARRR